MILKFAHTASVLGIGILLAGCGSTSTPSVDTNQDMVGAKKPASDDDLAKLIANAPDPLTREYGNKLIETAIAPATTARLKMLNAFVAAGIDRFKAGNHGPDPRQEAYNRLADQILVAHAVAPRDVTTVPAQSTGQTFETSLPLDGEGVGTVRFKIAGTASRSYELEFTMAQHRVKVGTIPQGATPEAAANQIANAISADKEAIEQRFFDESDIGAQTGEDPGSDGLVSRASGAVITLDPAING